MPMLVLEAGCKCQGPRGHQERSTSPEEALQDEDQPFLEGVAADNGVPEEHLPAGATFFTMYGHPSAARTHEGFSLTPVSC